MSDPLLRRLARAEAEGGRCDVRGDWSRIGGGSLCSALPRPRDLSAHWEEHKGRDPTRERPSHVHQRPRQDAHVRRHCVGFGVGRAVFDRLELS